MKKIYSLLILIMASLGLYKAQMTITQTGNVVNFSYTIDPSVWNTTPINLYAFVELSSASNGQFKELLGSWPGTTLSGTGPYTASVDLSTLYSAGVTISEIKYIYKMEVIKILVQVVLKQLRQALPQLLFHLH